MDVSLGGAGPNLKEWLREQFCDHPLEHCEDTRLHDAAYVGDLQTLRSLLQEESYRSRINEKSVWCCGWLPCTPLRIAATAGHGDCVDFLIRNGAEVDLVDVKGQTALYVAVVNGHLESAQILLEAGADPNGSRHHRSTPVYHTSRVGRADILQALIRYGADVDVNHHLTPDTRPPFSRRLTSLVVCPLYISAAYHNLQCFKLLLQAGANPDFNCDGPVDTQGFCRGSPGCVMDAVLRHGCEAAFVSLLVEFGANLSLVTWESLGPESRGRRKVDPEALQVFKEARSVPRALLSLCRVAVRRALGKHRLHLIPSLPLPDPIKAFLLHESLPSNVQICINAFGVWHVRTAFLYVWSHRGGPAPLCLRSSPRGACWRWARVWQAAAASVPGDALRGLPLWPAALSRCGDECVSPAGAGTLTVLALVRHEEFLQV
uniref:Ankyrin repeat and SOCS box protein 1 n=1 Tax=Suricata suricatta TaxID=37032 RepID=A0A673T109_SURSU